MFPKQKPKKSPKKRRRLKKKRVSRKQKLIKKTVRKKLKARALFIDENSYNAYLEYLRSLFRKKWIEVLFFVLWWGSVIIFFSNSLLNASSNQIAVILHVVFWLWSTSALASASAAFIAFIISLRKLIELKGDEKLNIIDYSKIELVGTIDTLKELEKAKYIPTKGALSYQLVKLVFEEISDFFFKSMWKIAVIGIIAGVGVLINSNYKDISRFTSELVGTEITWESFIQIPIVMGILFGLTLIIGALILFFFPQWQIHIILSELKNDLLAELEQTFSRVEHAYLTYLVYPDLLKQDNRWQSLQELESTVNALIMLLKREDTSTWTLNWNALLQLFGSSVLALLPGFIPVAITLFIQLG